MNSLNLLSDSSQRKALPLFSQIQSCTDLISDPSSSFDCENRIFGIPSQIVYRGEIYRQRSEPRAECWRKKAYGLADIRMRNGLRILQRRNEIDSSPYIATQCEKVYFSGYSFSCCYSPLDRVGSPLPMIQVRPELSFVCLRISYLANLMGPMAARSGHWEYTQWTSC